MSSELLLDARIPLVCIWALQIRICEPRGLVEGGRASNRYRCALIQRICREHSRSGLDRVQIARAELIEARPRAFKVLRGLSDRSPVVVEPSIGRAEHGFVGYRVGHSDPRLEVRQVVVVD